jgi:hypothetical protein
MRSRSPSSHGHGRSRTRAARTWTATSAPGGADGRLCGMGACCGSIATHARTACCAGCASRQTMQASLPGETGVVPRPACSMSSPTRYCNRPPAPFCWAKWRRSPRWPGNGFFRAARRTATISAQAECSTLSVVKLATARGDRPRYRRLQGRAKLDAGARRRVCRLLETGHSKRKCRAAACEHHASPGERSAAGIFAICAGLRISIQPGRAFSSNVWRSHGHKARPDPMR